MILYKIEKQHFFFTAGQILERLQSLYSDDWSFHQYFSIKYFVLRCKFCVEWNQPTFGAVAQIPRFAKTAPS